MSAEALTPRQESLLESLESIRVQDVVKSFETAHGSVYSYGEDGRTSRFKTETGEQMETQDITVFAHLTLDQQQDVLEAYRAKNPLEKTKVYVVERQEDGLPKIVRATGDISHPTELFLAIYRNRQMAENVPVSLIPKVGANVFDTRHYLKDGVWMTERHLGNKVTKVNYR
jgi:hypothetical protein